MVRTPWMLALTAALASACATTMRSTPPKELVQARATMAEADQREAGQLAPEAYRDAQEALARAEGAQRSGLPETTVRDLAYVARRRAERAEVLARAAQLSRAQSESEVQRQAQLVDEQLRLRQELEAARQRSSTSTEELRAREQALAQAEARLETQRRQLEEQQRRFAELEAQRRQLEEQQRQAAQQQAQLAAQAQASAAQAEAARQQAEERARALEAERQARAQAEADARAREQALAAEQRARQQAEEEAARALQRIAQVREEARGLVVTLAGPLLFQTGSAILTPQAQERLAQVAQVLREGDQPLMVEGHTDSHGNDAANEALSEKRAQVVRDFLVSQGIAPGRIQAHGYGEYRPVASNATSQGRAQNRRVEIVVSRQGQAVGGAGGQGQQMPEQQTPQQEMPQQEMPQQQMPPQQQ